MQPLLPAAAVRACGRRTASGPAPTEEILPDERGVKPQCGGHWRPQGLLREAGQQEQEQIVYSEVMLCCTEKPPTHFRISREIDAPALRQLLACIAVLALHVAEEEHVSAAEVLLHLEDPAADNPR